MQQEIDKLDIFLGQAENDWDLPVPVCIFSSFLQLILPFSEVKREWWII